MIKVPTKITPQYAVKLAIIPALINIVLKFESLLIIFTLESNIKSVITPTTKFVKQLFKVGNFFLIDRCSKNLNSIVLDP